jgi:hypothetical protein
LGEELADLETGLQANKIYTGEQKVQREGLRARSTCFGLQVVQKAGFRWRYEKPGHMESLPIVPIAHSSYMSHKRLESKDPKRGSDFGCLKDKWARSECKSRSNFWFYIWGQTQGVQVIEEASQWGVRQQRGCGGPHCGTRSQR